MIEPLFLNLQARDTLSNIEKDLLVSALREQRQFSSGQELVKIGSRPPVSTLLLDGFAARYKLLEDGKRQITALHVAGDFVDLHAFLLRKMDHGIVALSPCRVAVAPHDALKAISMEAPHLTRLLWLHTLIDGAIHREWIVAMGRRSTTSQLAHLICELFVRLQVVGRANGSSFHFPLSQAVMADVMGISIVQMNRVIQALRRERLIAWENHTISIVDHVRLETLAEFDQTYLSLSVEPR
jgi:CRP-like cAMP-binding protein